MISHTIKIEENSIWSSSTVFYIILSTILTFIVWWSATYPHSNDKIEESELLVAMTISYLLFGLLIIMMASHNENHMVSWLVVLGTLIPVVFVAFWLVYNNHSMKTEQIKN